MLDTGGAANAYWRQFHPRWRYVSETSGVLGVTSASRRSTTWDFPDLWRNPGGTLYSHGMPALWEAGNSLRFTTRMRIPARHLGAPAALEHKWTGQHRTSAPPALCAGPQPEHACADNVSCVIL